MERLSGLDAGLLYSESSAVPLNVCSVVELDTSTVPGGYTFERFSSDLASRMSALPELRAKLADSQLNLDHPVWVEDRDFDLSRHLKRISLPSPGGRQELVDICAHIAAVPLDRSKPLWEMWVIEGVGETDPREGGRLALMLRLHHAVVDGVSAANLLNQLCDPEPVGTPRDPVEGPGDATPLGIAADGLRRFVTRPLQLTRVIPETTSTLVTTVRRAVSGTAMAPPFKAPHTPFNAELTAERNIALAQLDLKDVKRVKNRYDVKVNDVVMALCAGALRGFLNKRAELPDRPMIAMVPSSVRDKSDRPGRNQLSGMFCNLHTDIDDPVQRLHAIAESDSHAKEHSSALGPTLLVDLAEIISRGTFGLLVNVMSRTPLTHTAIHNVIISNVAGPPHTLYSCGAEVKALYPLGPIFHGSGLNITVMSLGDKLNVGIISCPKLVDDLWDLADRFEDELKELLSRS
ncbi:WS/DGAT/MGAT family O-acyltransferase [Mycolicibacterium monacense]|uniref:Diacylglycerol O-acyltransferase n=1 Tax=Mycolicibacterium monacense TaxID=85693 RepID=A0AAD1N135_MYCMB|nr:wax ester/triacylglycerol synthase family O-acyltransferase [Mycolicibacterium monacense]MDA4100422.1 diacylglycerol O-acyltransferase [Mycolicibacterium monacense DSM 44395]OBF48832.1 diacylglycerol O-acyltransferase [Mycolicibacterium monacense]ORB21369.1 wax ester/triacylglycerol synthase family O-acyltransferase [Mycolicibacterium monacense DSM 44395]QHP84687.1 wax ester/triacylglycerol synthase family O-acyltransferase [Mycolicibacterium monacense DSM 44395]BBZ62515.1 diacylglycerol O-